MKPRYKVVKKRSRMSAVIHGNSKYALHYPKGHEVWAMEGTLGIMTFTSQYEAARFMRWWDEDYHMGRTEKQSLIMIRVKPLERGRSVMHISNRVSTQGLDMYYQDMYESVGEVQNGVMCYPGVLVLD